MTIAPIWRGLAGVDWKKAWQSLFPDWRALGAFCLPMLLYLFTLAPTIYNLDSAELTTAAATGGLMRSTGYPLYLLIGYFWSRLPVGDVGYRMNLFSAVSGALTIFLLDRLLRRMGVHAWAAFAALGSLAAASYFWALSLIAEVYTFHTVLMAISMLRLLHWAENPTPRRMFILALSVGLGLTHHAATILLIPGYLWYLVWTRPRQFFALPNLAAGVIGGLSGLSVYLYLPLRYATEPVFNYAGRYNAEGVFQPVNLQTLSGLWWLISGRAFQAQMAGYRWENLWPQAAGFGMNLGRAFLLIGIGPGIAGFLWLLRHRWKWGSATLWMFLAHAAFYISYRVGDKDTMYLPDYLIWALWMGVGCQWLLDWLANSPHPLEHRAGVWLARSILVGGVIVTIWWNWGLVDLSQDWSARQRGEMILAQCEPGALFFGFWDTVPVIQYLQLVEGQRTDVQAINRFLISPTDLQLWIRREIALRPVYIDKALGNLPDSLIIEPLVEINRLHLRKLGDPLP